jgi:D-amino-acid oxidase
VKFAASFTTLTIHAPKHILYLYQRLKRDYGVRFIRQKLASLNSAFSSPSTKIVFNCTGNAAKTLPGVEDPKCYPTRGQVLLALAPKVNTNIMRHSKDSETYVIPRPYSNGQVILGGYMQKGNGYAAPYLRPSHKLMSPSSDGATYAYETESILDRTRELSTEVRESDLEVIAAFSGLRPSREGGARVEREDLTVGGQKRTVVHNYGAGGTGFQAGYGMALDAVAAAKPLLLEIQGGVRSML